MSAEERDELDRLWLDLLWSWEKLSEAIFEAEVLLLERGV
jgi:hypothetical protein